MEITRDPVFYTASRELEGRFYNDVDTLLIPSLVVENSYSPKRWCDQVNQLGYFEVGSKTQSGVILTVADFKKVLNLEKTAAAKQQLIAHAPRFAVSGRNVALVNLLIKQEGDLTLDYERCSGKDLVGPFQGEQSDYFLTGHSVEAYFRQLGLKHYSKILRKAHNLGYFVVDRTSAPTLKMGTPGKRRNMGGFPLANSRAYTLEEVNAFITSLT